MHVVRENLSKSCNIEKENNSEKVAEVLLAAVLATKEHKCL